MTSPRRHHLIAPIIARPYLQLAAVIALAVYVILPGGPLMAGGWRLATRVLVAWDVFVAVYLALAANVMRRSSVDDIRRRAPQYDAGAKTILTLSVVAALASFAAVVAEMSMARQGGGYGVLPLIFAIVTIGLSWAFVHVIFALHYAHDFYSPEPGEARPALIFPGTTDPRYGEFVYFAFVIGCACATADVNIASPSVRRLAAAHGVIAFFFNTAIVALSINIAAGLIGS